MYESHSLILMQFTNIAPLTVSLRGIFLLHVSKDYSVASLGDLLDLVVQDSSF